MPKYSDPAVQRAIQKLAEDFPRLRWDFSPDPGSSELVSHWLGEADEEVMVNVFKGKRINEQFHCGAFRLSSGLSVTAASGENRKNLFRAAALGQNAAGPASAGSHGPLRRKNSRHAGIQQQQQFLQGVQRILRPLTPGKQMMPASYPAREVIPNVNKPLEPGKKS